MAKPTKAQIRRIARERFAKARKAESGFERQLNSVAKQVGSLVRGFAPEGVVPDIAALRSALHRYSEILKPWARAVSEKMQRQVALRDAKSWRELGATMGREMRREIATAPVAQSMRELLASQVELITSLPMEAAERVHRLSTEALMNSSRADEIAKEILRSGEVTKSRAQLIARTEVARTASVLVETRSKNVGSDAYIWRTSGDSAVRKEHRRLEGKVIRWDAPPIAGPDGMRYHAGQGPNCRCFAEPILPAMAIPERRAA
jgi:SPP1 gp7 family putative phage head morphogenesis protein